jgi:membrane protein insertase Oxa1/YidC/SpoIIIJ
MLSVIMIADLNKKGRRHRQPFLQYFYPAIFFYFFTNFPLAISFWFSKRSIR